MSATFRSCCCCCFFFSSRRRHTRLQGDWSSDVCSSDLYPYGQAYRDGIAVPGTDLAGTIMEEASPGSAAQTSVKITRSEEHTSELHSPCNLVCRLLLEKKKKKHMSVHITYNTSILSTHT